MQIIFWCLFNLIFDFKYLKPGVGRPQSSMGVAQGEAITNPIY